MANKADNMVIAQSGGPSMVINASLVGAVFAAKRAGARIGRILGARHGIKGILGRDYIDLRVASAKKLEATIRSAVRSERTTFVEVIVDPRANVYPMQPGGQPVEGMIFE